MKISLFILFLTIGAHAAFSLGVTDLRNRFESVALSMTGVESFLSELEALPKEPVYQAYHAAATAVMAGTRMMPWNKYACCQRSMSEFETAVRSAPGNLEIRYLRFCVQTKLPSFLRMNDHLVEDRKTILKLLPLSIDQDLNRRVAKFLLSSGKCAKEETVMLQKFI